MLDGWRGLYPEMSYSYIINHCQYIHSVFKQNITRNDIFISEEMVKFRVLKSGNRCLLKQFSFPVISFSLQLCLCMCMYMPLNRWIVKVTVRVFNRSGQRSWREQYEGPIHHQASEYVQTETEMVIKDIDLHFSCELLIFHVIFL